MTRERDGASLGEGEAGVVGQEEIFALDWRSRDEVGEGAEVVVAQEDVGGGGVGSESRVVVRAGGGG